MKYQFISFLIITLFVSEVKAQGFSVPDSILNEIYTTKLQVNAKEKDSLAFKIIYPANYDSTKSYPVLLALAGGNQAEPIVNYCYAAWFKSNYFKQHLTILPVNSNGKNLKDYAQDEILRVLSSIKNNFQTVPGEWIVAGTSNGGAAAFNFVSAEPSLFKGAIVIPGRMADAIQINDSWIHLKVVLAYGDKDDNIWINECKKIESKLTDKVKSIKTVVMKGQGHLLQIGYPINTVYDSYFK